MFVSLCVVKSSSNLPRLTYVPAANDTQHEEHSRRIYSDCPLINTSTNICWTMCLYSSAIYDVLDGKRISQRKEKERVDKMYKTVIYHYFYFLIQELELIHSLDQKRAHSCHRLSDPKGSFNCLFFSEHNFIPANQQF